MKKLLTAVLLMLSVPGFGATYYLDANSGNDQGDGKGESSAWKTLKQASQMAYQAGDQLLLKKGGHYEGALTLKAKGSEGKPVMIGAYGEGADPIVDAKDAQAALIIDNSSYVEVSNLEIVADGKGAFFGIDVITPKDAENTHIYFRNLYIHDIFSDPKGVNRKGTKEQDANNLGMGIHVAPEGKLSDIVVENCRIERTSFKGMFFRGPAATTPIENIRVLNNKLINIGGPGIQPSIVKNMIVRGNVVDHSGASVESRQYGRGSGIWPWGSENVLIENNKFMHARGIADSCGAHIDFNCRNVLVQRNLSLDNEGGFVEILGNDWNCCYRYNVSINDGARIKGKNNANMDGKVLWLSGFVGKTGRANGPYNSYIYNNTVYGKKDIHAAVVIAKTAKGALFANNIFYLLGPVKKSWDDQTSKPASASTAPSISQNVIFNNNLYQRLDPLWPKDLNAMVADPGFKNAGGEDPDDYIPANKEAIQDKGIEIEKLTGDEIGLTAGLKVTEDFFGNPIVGKPDLGAIELK